MCLDDCFELPAGELPSFQLNRVWGSWQPPEGVSPADHPFVVQLAPFEVLVLEALPSR